MFKTWEVQFVSLKFVTSAPILPMLVLNCSEKNRLRLSEHSHLSVFLRKVMVSTLRAFFMLKTGAVDFVSSLFRHLCTNPSDFGAKLFRKSSAWTF
jgi:hypothetical protein